MREKCRLHVISEAIKQAYGNKCMRIKANDFHKFIKRLCHIEGDINGEIPAVEGERITPSTVEKKFNGKRYLKSDVIVEGDKNLIGQNILRGSFNQQEISIFGVKGELDIVRKFDNYKAGSEYWGLHVADVARSYHLAKMNGEATFRYSQNKGIWENGQLTDEDGRCWLDCSGFMGLVLRGIEFKDSPYFKVKGQANKTLSHLGLDRTVIKKLCDNSPHKWANKYLDRQTHPALKDIGVKGYKSIRNAGQQAEYYFGQGVTLYEYEKGNPPTSIPEGLQAGDLIFWSKETASDFQKTRFKAISHVALVGRDTTKYYQVTGYADERVTETIFYSNIADHLDEISLIVRPNYNPVFNGILENTNLLPKFSFDSCSISPNVTSYGVKYTPQLEGGFNVQRETNSSKHSTFYIARDSKPIKLTAGNYKLSGCPVNPTASETPTVYDWGLAIKTVDTDENIAWCKGSDIEFTISKTTDVYCYFFVSSSIEIMSNPLTCVPKLIKL